MKLKKRLYKIAELVEEDTVIDVGCDHALLDIYLAKEKGKKAIASDINKNAYEIAKRNIQKYELENQIELFLTNGVSGLPIKEDSTLVLAGMGTLTMKQILKELKEYPNQIILQSNNDLESLRKYITSIGYYIDQEEIVIEGKIFNVILSCKKGSRVYEESDYLLGPIIKKQKREEDKKYFQFLISIHENILKNIPKNETELIQKETQLLQLLKSE